MGGNNNPTIRITTNLFPLTAEEELTLNEIVKGNNINLYLHAVDREKLIAVKEEYMRTKPPIGGGDFFSIIDMAEIVHIVIESPILLNVASSLISELIKITFKKIKNNICKKTLVPYKIEYNNESENFIISTELTEENANKQVSNFLNTIANKSEQKDD